MAPQFFFPEQKNIEPRKIFFRSESETDTFRSTALFQSRWHPVRKKKTDLGHFFQISVWKRSLLGSMAEQIKASQMKLSSRDVSCSVNSLITSLSIPRVLTKFLSHYNISYTWLMIQCITRKVHAYKNQSLRFLWTPAKKRVKSHGTPTRYSVRHAQATRAFTNLIIGGNEHLYF